MNFKILDTLKRKPEELHENNPWINTAFYASVGLLFLFYFMAPVLFSLLSAEFKALPKNVQVFLVVVPHQILLIAGMFFVAAFAEGGKRSIGSRLGFLSCKLNDLYFAFILLILVFPLSAIANSLVYIISSKIGIELPAPVVGHLLKSCAWPGLTIIAFGALVLAPVGEEIIFRRVIFCFASKYVSVSGAAVISSAAFAAAHFNIRHFAGLFILGLALQFLYIRSRSLYPCMLLHFLQNLISITGILFLKLG